MQPLRPEDRPPRRGRRDDELAFGDEAGRIGDGARLDLEHRRDVAGAILSLRRIARPDEGAGEGADEMRRRELQPRLRAGAEHARRLDMRRRQMLRRDGARRRPDIRQIAVVEQHRLDEAGAGAQQHHEAVEARQSALRIVEEAGADLDGEAWDAGDIGGLHIDLAVRLGNVEAQDRRHRHRLGRERVERRLDDGDGVGVDGDAAAKLRLGQDDYLSHPRTSLSPIRTDAPLAMRASWWRSRLQPLRMSAVGPRSWTLPARRAAADTAAAPSATRRSSRRRWAIAR